MDSNEEKYVKCWVCNSLVLKARLENHHILGGEHSEKITPLCILCHDMVDRMPLENLEVFQEFLINTLEELKRVPEDFRWTKLYILKIAKIIPYSLKLTSKDKQIEQPSKGQELQ